MIHHQKYTPSKYEYVIKDTAGRTVFTLWTIRKTAREAIKCASANLEQLQTATKTAPNTWYTCPTGIENQTAGLTGSYTGRTLFEARGYSK